MSNVKYKYGLTGGHIVDSDYEETGEDNTHHPLVQLLLELLCVAGESKLPLCGMFLPSYTALRDNMHHRPSPNAPPIFPATNPFQLQFAIGKA
jgi:hypothetical protein